MKITKSYLKQLIKEELDKLDEQNPLAQPIGQTQQLQQKPDPAQEKAQKDNLKTLLKQKTSDLLAAKAASDKINSLQREIDEINKQIASMGG